MFSAVHQQVGRAARVRRDSHDETYSRLEVLWAVASFVVLILCWDASCRLDERVSIPRVRLAHALEEERTVRSGTTHPINDFE